MANFYGTARTNYFKVKDEEKFKEFVNSMPDLHLIEDGEGRFGFYSESPDSGCFPSSYWDDETDEDIDIDIVGETAEHLAEGEVAIFMEAGAEKCRYINGWATAVNHTGEYVNISLMDIYKLAKEKFGIKPTLAEY